MTSSPDAALPGARAEPDASARPDEHSEPDASARPDDPVARGRVVEGRRTVRMSDAGPDRRARLDALARYLHDVAEDDAADAAMPPGVGWVLRSTRMEVGRFPALGEQLSLRTFCTAAARRWAERTTLIVGGHGARVRAVSIWVAVDASTGTPTRLGDWFFSVYGPSAGGRRASARLVLGGPGEAARRSARPWPLRRSDVDAWAHVNNAIAWAALEDATAIPAGSSVTALVEHHAPIGADSAPILAAEGDDGERLVWLLDGGQPAPVRMAARIEVRAEDVDG